MTKKNDEETRNGKNGERRNEKCKYVMNQSEVHREKNKQRENK